MRDGKPSQSALQVASTSLGRTEKVCPICGGEFLPKYNAQKYCGRSCAGKARKRKSAAPVKKRRKMTKIKITKRIDVFPALMPEQGRIYRAQKCPAFYIIPNICGKKIVVREDECVEV